MVYDKIIGIDPGVSQGCICHMNEKGYHTTRMPREAIDIERVFKTLRADSESPLAFIEKVNTWNTDQDNPGKQFHIDKMNKNYAQIIALLISVGIPYIEVHPATWQAILGLRPKKGENLSKTERKNRHKEAAQMYTMRKLSLWQADGVCIAEFGFRKVTSDPAYIHQNIKGQLKQSTLLF